MEILKLSGKEESVRGLTEGKCFPICKGVVWVLVNRRLLVGAGVERLLPCYVNAHVLRPRGGLIGGVLEWNGAWIGYDRPQESIVVAKPTHIIERQR